MEMPKKTGLACFGPKMRQIKTRTACEDKKAQKGPTCDQMTSKHNRTQ